MSFRALSAGFLIWPAFVSALECKITASPLPELTWENFNVEAGRGSEVIVVHERLLSSAERNQVARDIGDEGLSMREILENGKRLLEGNKETLSNQATLLLFMNKALKAREVQSVYLDYPPDKVPEWIKFAEKIYLQVFQIQLRGSPSDVVLDRLLILTVGVPLYLRAVDPAKFSDIALEGISSSAERALASAAGPGRAADADDSFQALEDKLRKNRSSLETARAMRKRLHDGEFKHLSNDEIRERVLARFWRRAHPAVREWLDAELGAKPKAPSANAGDFARSLLLRKGRTVLFLHDEKFARFKKDFSELCN